MSARTKPSQLQGGRLLIDQGPFGDFKSHGGHWHVVGCQHAGHIVWKTWVLDILGAKIDRNVEVLARPKVGAVILRHLSNHRTCKYADQVGFFRHRNENIRRHLGAVVVPAGK
ncbi:hypothetical protein D3C75_527410 [compost metagenome]